MKNADISLGRNRIRAYFFIHRIRKFKENMEV